MVERESYYFVHQRIASVPRVADRGDLSFDTDLYKWIMACVAATQQLRRFCASVLRTRD